MLTEKRARSFVFWRCVMTADIRTAAGRESAGINIPVWFPAHGLRADLTPFARKHFVQGAVWAQARLTPTREQIEKVLTDHEIGDGGTPHSWRCEYPDLYPGHCTCVRDIATDLLALIGKLAEGESSE